MANRAHLKKKTPAAPVLEEIDHPALKRKRVTSSRMPKYIESIMAAIAPYLLPEVMESLRKNVAIGDTKAAELALKAYKILPVAGINVTQTNTNATAVEAVGGHKTYDAYIRDRAVEKRMVVNATATVIEEAEECLSRQQLPVGSET